MRLSAELAPIEIQDFQIAPKRRMQLTLFLPRGRGMCPVVIFSHGNPVPPRFYYYLARAWRKRGIATLFVHHLPDGENVRRSSEWPVRARDIKKVLSLLGKIHPRLNRRAVGVAGHSHGAHAAAVLAGAVLFLPGGRRLKSHDRRVGAVILISPPGSGTMGLRASSKSRIKIPLLEIAGALEAGGARRRGGVLVDGARHESFIDAILLGKRREIISRPNRKILKQTQRLTTDFLVKVFQTPTPKKH